MDFAKALLLSSAAFSLFGCEDITGEDANSPPTVLVQNTSGIEKSVVNLNISANDPDDNIVEYKLEQNNGSLSTNQVSGSNIAITLPEVTEAETLHFTLTVTDEEGAQAQDQFTVEVTPITTELTLEGQVTLGRHNSTAGLDVTIEIGSQSFTTSSNELGQYQAQISIDDSNLDQLLQQLATMGVVMW